MFYNKKKEAPVTEGEAAATANPDLIIHNMPSHSRLSGASSNSQALSSGGFALPPAPRRNFQMVGLIIIAASFIFISGLAYFSYVFIIKPAANNNQEIVNTPAVVSSPATTTPAAPISPVSEVPTNDLSVVAPAAVDLATSSAAATSTGIVVTGTTLPPLVDSDNDGLNDEEEMILGTAATSSDTNANTYSDLTEINNNYNPTGAGRLAAAASLAQYTDPNLGYRLLYPKNWPVQSANNGATIIFAAPDESLIQIYAQDNPEKAGILSWYEESFPGATPSYDKLKSAATWDGIISEDKLNFYLTDKKHDNILVVSYVPAVTGRIAYPNIFQLMFNSLLLK